MAYPVDKKTQQPIGRGYMAPGLGNTNSYLVSGVPWITGSATLGADAEHKIEFPSITKSVTVIRHDTPSSADHTLRVHFHSAAIANRVIAGYHFVELDSNEDSYTFNVKCKEIYLSTPNNGSNREYRVVAELTHIPTHEMYALSGSGQTQ